MATARPPLGLNCELSGHPQPFRGCLALREYLCVWRNQRKVTPQCSCTRESCMVGCAPLLRAQKDRVRVPSLQPSSSFHSPRRSHWRLCARRSPFPHGRRHVRRRTHLATALSAFTLDPANAILTPDQRSNLLANVQLLRDAIV